MDVGGHCAPRFAKLKDAFAKNFAVGDEVGASFAATSNGELVVDLWGGSADRARTRPWERVAEMIPPDPPMPLSDPPKPGDPHYEFRRALANPPLTQAIANTHLARGGGPGGQRPGERARGGRARAHAGRERARLRLTARSFAACGLGSGRPSPRGLGVESCCAPTSIRSCAP